MLLLDLVVCGWLLHISDVLPSARLVKRAIVDMGYVRYVGAWAPCAPMKTLKSERQ